MLRAGIVGLPNVGKSTLFNAVTRTRKAQAANYPFCTIDPNVGIVTVPDARLAVLQKIAKTEVVIPAAIEFVDIAGLVKGASQGEGLGNQFLSHIREVDAIVQVVRCFEDADIHHVAGTVDPVRDIEVINTELVLADLDAVKKQRERVAKDAKRGDKDGGGAGRGAREDRTALDAGKPALTLALTPEEKAIAREFFLLTDKPTIFACNVKETDLAGADSNPYVAKVREYARTHLACEAVVISAQIESELVDLSADEADAFLQGSRRAGERRGRAHPRHLSSARPADLFHRRRKGSARLDDPCRRQRAQGRGRHPHRFRARLHQGRDGRLRRPRRLRLDGRGAREGPLRMEGKEYVVKDGDVLLFKFNV